jgi:hypothetical protein
MTGLEDYFLGGIVIGVILNGVTIMIALAVNAKIGKQQRLIGFIHSRAMKAKKLEEHREKLEEEKLAKLRKTRTGAKK